MSNEITILTVYSENPNTPLTNAVATQGYDNIKNREPEWNITKFFDDKTKTAIFSSKTAPADCFIDALHKEFQFFSVKQIIGELTTAYISQKNQGPELTAEIVNLEYESINKKYKAWNVEKFFDPGSRIAVFWSEVAQPQAFFNQIRSAFPDYLIQEFVKEEN
jgi:hypothetical protein